ncbi:hypothetical protein CRU98_12845 [Arcobacter sp. CECT 8986]|uniref:Lcl C-terminal domain-containing protein n=1 Tax=Arcobacter sp. CECT 8986 TaxID=2044507 RepID=UPI001009DBAC|nr:DUF1566 domain-containing protein [Arcobacter sp. CECT 8986]RXJ97698.1 hypothetical protein CRU98_12845 [Arcobacter sp. CECT 8986]
MKLLFFLFVSTFLYANSFERINNLDIVVDRTAKIMWQDNIDVVKVRKTHQEAEDYCENLQIGTFSNWRLPTIEEFKLIVNKKNKKNFINRKFKYNLPDGYWASKAHWRTLWYYADYMHFISGTAYYDSRHKNKYIRCVKDLK